MWPFAKNPCSGEQSTPHQNILCSLKTYSVGCAGLDSALPFPPSPSAPQSFHLSSRTDLVEFGLASVHFCSSRAPSSPLSSLPVPSTGPRAPQLGRGSTDWSPRQGHLQAVSPEEEELSRGGLCPPGALLPLLSLGHFLQAAGSQLRAGHTPWAQDRWG